MSWKGLATAGFLLGMIGMTASMRATTTGGDAAPATFNKDVLPILQKNCQTCHRPGEIAPMSFLTYKDARPWAKAMKSAVVSRQMPPWFADPALRTFCQRQAAERRRHQHDRRLGGQRRAGRRRERHAGAG